MNKQLIYLATGFGIILLIFTLIRTKNLTPLIGILGLLVWLKIMLRRK